MDKLIKDTQGAFDSSDLWKRVADVVPVQLEEYQALHSANIVPLDIRIDCEQFKREIQQFNQYFLPWGNTQQSMPRYGLPLINLDGEFSVADPTVGSLTDWNKQHPNQLHIETDFTCPTEVMQLQSLQPLQVFNNYLTRSNILKWNKGAEFLPHIDTTIPSYWFRVWGTTHSDIELGFLEEDSFIIEQNIEPGRLYLIDTSKVHIAKSNIDDDVYQFFLSLNTNARELLWKYM